MLDELVLRTPCARCGQARSHCAIRGSFYCLDCAEIVQHGPPELDPMFFIRTIGVERRLGFEEIERFVTEQIIAATPGWRVVHVWNGATSEEPIVCWALGRSTIYRFPNRTGKPIVPPPPENEWVEMDRQVTVHGLVRMASMPADGLDLPFGGNCVGYVGPGESAEQALATEITDYYESRGGDLVAEARTEQRLNRERN
jgi:hypothetical protein